MFFSLVFSFCFSLFILFDYFIDKKNNQIKNKKTYLLGAILIFLSIFIRSYKFTDTPLPINFDEASIGYEAYSIANYGIDRNGKTLPVHLIAWGSGQNALYAYLSIPFIKIFGNTVFSVRLLMLISSSFSIVIMFYLFKDIFKEKYLYAFLIFSIMPWHIMKSRWALDCNIFPDVILLTIYLYNLFFKTNNKKFIYINSVLLGISTYAYGSSYIFVPVYLFLNLMYLYKKKYINIRDFITCFFITTIISFPMILFVIINYFDLKEISVFGITIPRLLFNRFNDVTVINDKNIFISLINNFKNNLSLIFSGDDFRLLNIIPGYGALYYLSIPFIFVGIYDLIKRRKDKDIFNIIISNLIGGILIMFFVTKSVHRINVIWYPIIIVIVVGIYKVISLNINYQKIILFGYLISFSLFSIYYFNRYNDTLKIMNNKGYYECLKYIKENKIEYENLIISNSLDLPYIYYLYVFEVDPNMYLKKRNVEKGKNDFQNITKIDNVYFKEVKEIKEENTYIITEFKSKAFNLKENEIKCFGYYCVVK